jgi:hypothetical protein
VLRALSGREVIGEWPMSFTGETNHYAAEIALDALGQVELQMLAAHPSEANFGIDTRSVRVAR